MSSIKSKHTKPELTVRNLLWKRGLRGYRLHWKKVPGTPDIAFPGKMVAIFINGCYWHRCPHCNPNMPKSNTDFWKEKFFKNVKRDKHKVETLRNIGWQVVTLWECRIKQDSNFLIEELDNIISNTSKRTWALSLKVFQ